MWEISAYCRLVGVGMWPATDQLIKIAFGELPRALNMLQKCVQSKRKTKVVRQLRKTTDIRQSFCMPI